MKRHVLGIVLVLAAIATIVVVVMSKSAGRFLWEVVSHTTTGDDEKALLQMSEDLNKQLPLQVDAETRADITTVGPERRITYFYTLLNYPSPGRNIFDAFDHMAEKETAAKKVICGNKVLRAFLAHNVTIVYAFKFNDGKNAYDISVSTGDCVSGA